MILALTSSASPRTDSPNSPLSVLPAPILPFETEDLTRYISSFLPIKDLQNMSTVNRIAYKLFKSKEFWAFLYCRDVEHFPICRNLLSDLSILFPTSYLQNLSLQLKMIPETLKIFNELSRYQLRNLYLENTPGTIDNHKKYLDRLYDVGENMGPHINNICINGLQIGNVLIPVIAGFLSICSLLSLLCLTQINVLRSI